MTPTSKAAREPATSDHGTLSSRGANVRSCRVRADRSPPKWAGSQLSGDARRWPTGAVLPCRSLRSHDRRRCRQPTRAPDHRAEAGARCPCPSALGGRPFGSLPRRDRSRPATIAADGVDVRNCRDQIERRRDGGMYVGTCRGNVSASSLWSCRRPNVEAISGIGGRHPLLCRTW